MVNFGNYSMKARPRNAPTIRTEIPKSPTQTWAKSVAIDIWSILEKSASSIPVYTPLALTTIAKSAQDAVGILEIPSLDFSTYTDEQVFRRYFQEFNEKEFVDFLNILLSEIRAMRAQWISKDIMINHLTTEIWKFLTSVRDNISSDTSVSQGKQQILISLISEFKKRLVTNLKDKLSYAT